MGGTSSEWDSHSCRRDRRNPGPYPGGRTGRPPPVQTRVGCGGDRDTGDRGISDCVPADLLVCDVSAVPDWGRLQRFRSGDLCHFARDRRTPVVRSAPGTQPVGAISTAVGIGASLSQAIAGSIVHRFGTNVGFLFLASVAASAFAILYLFMPETRDQRFPAPSAALS